MPVFFAVLLAGTHLVLAAEHVPQLNVDPTCHAAAMAMPAQDRHEDVCKRDEFDARDKLQKEWGQFTVGQRDHCVTLSTLGGSPS